MSLTEHTIELNRTTITTLLNCGRSKNMPALVGTID